MSNYPISSLPFLVLFACGTGKEDADCYEGFERDFEGNCVASNDGGSTDGTDQDANAGTDGDTTGEVPTDSGAPEGGSTDGDGNLDGIDDGGADETGTDGMADGTGGAGGSTTGGSTTGGSTADGSTTGGSSTGTDTDLDGGTGDDSAGDDGGLVDVDPCEGRTVGTTVGTCATDFALVNHTGLEVRLKDFAGDVIVLDLSSFT